MLDIRDIKDKDLRELALKRKEEQKGTSFDLFEDKCFLWRNTAEGWNFWNEVYTDKITKL